jgi:hypothetical protein
MAHDPFNEDELNVYEFLKPGVVAQKRTPFGIIYLGLETGDVHIIQRWRYSFRPPAGQPDWTHQQKAELHHKFKSEIWTFWNSRRPTPPSGDPVTNQLLQLLNSHNRVLFNVSGTSAFARKFNSVGIPITFNVLLSIATPHWRINIGPLPRGQRTNVDWDRHIISFDPADLQPTAACTAARAPVCRPDFQTMPHEFGHTLMVDDEYNRGSRHLADTTSIMNIGDQVRPRHLIVILRQLNTMLANTRFSLPPN